ncbi:hypothetical protein ABGT16_04740 [Pseudomonas asiatica]|uniref:hypothetical protein n=1 Tax=Pseudomonas TaxID=286 RepID=UPI001BAE6FA4|nr:hypothetical protein [Pseudomonas putida]QUG93070.1 hypothetical protein GR140_30350 [Pseudomonas putida]
MSTTNSVSLFDLLNVAQDLTLCGEEVCNWMHEKGTDPGTFRLDTFDRFYRFEDQLVGLEDGTCTAETVTGECISVRAELKRPVTPDDVLAAMGS